MNNALRTQVVAILASNTNLAGRAATVTLLAGKVVHALATGDRAGQAVDQALSTCAQIDALDRLELVTQIIALV